MQSKLLSKADFIAMMESNINGWFTIDSVEEYCEAHIIYFDIGYCWDCVYKHKVTNTIKERYSGKTKQKVKPSNRHTKS